MDKTRDADRVPLPHEPEPGIVVGWTGSRFGMTDRQKDAATILLHLMEIREFHHGACIGADEEAVGILAMVGDNPMIVAHPSNMELYTSSDALAASTLVKPVRGTIERNDDIVGAVDLLIAAPKQRAEAQRSGTWTTVRHARIAGIPVVILDP